MADFLPEPYAAYGSNLCPEQMLRRCPQAEVAGSLLLPGWRLRIGRFASIEPAPGAFCPVGLWRITAACLAALDRFEGANPDEGAKRRKEPAYERKKIALPDGRKARIYIENTRRDGPPSEEYVARLRRGYRFFGFDPAPLEEALARAGFGAA
ncbi:gamma-glutamylcyclotransferase [Caldovatus sediminis]|uniref:Gamma-glutamylcyclotransferase n=1 Tax=Caldovatus sediminis TaxID=2041189 RepID=A0A8J2Z8T3_9PROT|nr:gamma-glutamylcyclotransferase family protein [Caldovatus sediminis]GGG21416.1 gamma-glutamylcyclotransferase [Caldovatus sediminis]